MATNIGTGPQDIPLNQFLGEMAYMDNLYEFGSWDPTINLLGNHTKSPASGGFYQRVGKMVYVTFNYQWTNRSTTNGGYGVRITNLPFRHDTSIGNIRATGGVHVAGVENILPGNGGRYHFGGYLDGTDIYFRVSGAENGNTEQSLDGSVSTSSGTGYIYGTAYYITTGERFLG